MKQGLIAFGFAFLIAVHSAPVEIKEEAKRRETTKETLELENSLKRLAGENKQYFTENGAQPMPQVDGLEDHPDSPGPVHHQGIHSLEADAEDDQEQGREEQLQASEKELENLEHEAEEAEDPQAEESDQNNDEDKESIVQNQDIHTNDNKHSNENNDLEDTDIPSSDEMELDNEVSEGALGQQPIYYPEQGYGNNYINYKGDYPYAGNAGDIDGNGQNEDYVVQDVLVMMEQHPKLWHRLMQAKNDLTEEEERNAEDTGEEDSNDHIDNSEPQLENMRNLAENYYQQPENIYDKEEEALQKMKALQQYEKFQQLYGDSEAHVVAKKKGYGPAIENTATGSDGSGDILDNHQKENQEEKEQEQEKQELKNTVAKEEKLPVDQLALM